MDIKKAIDKRQESNREILSYISEMVEKYPDLRFGQILANLHIIEYEHDYINDVSTVKDPFNEESIVTASRIRSRWWS
jgi:hypothetical protein